MKIDYENMSFSVQNSYTAYIIISVGNDRRDIRVHINKKLDIEIVKLMNYILEKNDHNFFTVSLNVREYKTSGKVYFNEFYNTRAIVDLYDGKMGAFRNKLNLTRSVISAPKSIGMQRTHYPYDMPCIETPFSKIVDLNLGYGIEKFYAHCSFDEWKRGVAKYKINT